jgi:hypothetical protein
MHASDIVDAAGDDVMSVKANQSHLRADIELIVAVPSVGDPQENAVTIGRRHRRIEQRRITTSQAHVG